MVTAAYKKQLIEKIRNTNDEKILKEIEKCLSKPVYKLSSDEKKSIIAGENDIQTGSVLSSEEAAKERSQWL